MNIMDKPTLADEIEGYIKLFDPEDVSVVFGMIMGRMCNIQKQTGDRTCKGCELSYDLCRKMWEYVNKYR